MEEGSISHRNLDTVQQPLLPTMQRRDHSPVSFAADGWVERLVGHRKFFEKLVADGQVAAPPPISAVSSDEKWRQDRFSSYLINWAEIYAVVNRVFLVFAAVDGDSIEELAVQFYCLRIWVPGRTIAFGQPLCLCLR